MSTIQDRPGIWSIKESDSRYEKCRNITEEIYKRINITFQIKQLETAAQSDVSEQSDQIDSNELSNETDLFACDKTSISSSTEPERPKDVPVAKFINNNNNEEKLTKPIVVCKRPRKRFRKRVKKRQSKQASESDASSDEALPLSRMLDVETRGKEERERGEWGSESSDRVMGVPLVPVVRLVKVQTKDIKPKIQPSAKPTKMQQVDQGMAQESKPVENVDKSEKGIDDAPSLSAKEKSGMKSCTMCSLSFRGERGLRRHLTMSHIMEPKNDRKPA